MNDFDVISFLGKKSQNLLLSKDEIFSFIDLVGKDAIPNYQVSAFLMAVAIHGLTDQETTWLTVAIANSGKIHKIPNKGNRVFIDKHSSGGIGDKTSLILLPILAAAGFYILKSAGRGLGFTGGTIDKLESIGVNTDLSFERALDVVDKSKMLIISQTKDVAPVDKKLYELRDVTSTVESIPLIASSIMSKKMAFEVDYLFLDIKYGTGAFCRNLDYAKKLAKIMNSIGKLAHLNLFIHISAMQQPLGYAVGNAIEVLESQDFLSGENLAPDLYEFIEKFSIDIFLTTNLFSNAEDAKARFAEIIKNKEALKICEIWFENQGADIQKYKDKSYFAPKYKHDVFSKGSGYFSVIDNKQIGYISNKLGAGRTTIEDEIDSHAGIFIHKRINDYVKEGDLLYTFYSSNAIDSKLENEILENTFLSKEKHHVDDLIISYKDC